MSITDICAGYVRASLIMWQAGIDARADLNAVDKCRRIREYIIREYHAAMWARIAILTFTA